MLYPSGRLPQGEFVQRTKRGYPGVSSPTLNTNIIVFALLLHDPNAKSFTSMEELRADLLSDEDDDI